MAVTIDWQAASQTPPYRGKVFIPQSYLTLVQGTLYKLDTEQFRKDLKVLEAAEEGIVFPDTMIRFKPYTVAGVQYAQAILMQYQVEFEDGQYSVILEGSNNDIWDIENDILQQNQVQVIPTNSAGLIVVEALSQQAIEDEIQNLTDGVYGKKVVIESSDAAGGVPGYLVLWDASLVLLGHKEIWETEDKTIGYRGRGIGHESALLAGLPSGYTPTP